MNVKRRRMTAVAGPARTLGALATAAALALTVPNSAYAAEGILNINGQDYVNPSGCYGFDWFPASITNNTDAIVEVHSGPDCTGSVEWLVYPGETYRTETASSVFIL
ncbi:MULTISPECIES: hypothetical protein [unclassified Streptomyces]|uniref:hypothetical protein n=1 Tax=unclassified Streptomyces TaxID=2593676 RepID=UPI00136DD4EF|nr:MULTISPECIES: hypothetical protein [unclassified Streptomyces]MYY83996.1 hypothetical protein [Streptomyces sp. SID335]MYZ14294.1 hypothetical protein [Streptomyces sp. SID337]NDZ86995.1 hypothetical protein [Streptomyces sp. SID10115]NEB44210.1 hypothetical protein [Streptomyces sp. SID339]